MALANKLRERPRSHAFGQRSELLCVVVDCRFAEKTSSSRMRHGYIIIAETNRRGDSSGEQRFRGHSGTRFSKVNTVRPVSSGTIRSLRNFYGTGCGLSSYTGSERTKLVIDDGLFTRSSGG